jgi:enterobacterial common antigen flippase
MIAATPTAATDKEAAASAAHGRSSYLQILRSSALIGGATAITVVIGIVRTKALALLMGPAGIGLLGVFSSIIDVARNAIGLGVSSSGVRQIAEAQAAGDVSSISRTVIALRRATMALAVAGAALMALFSAPIAIFTFGDTQHSTAIMLLALAVALRLVSDSQSALLQGLRRIGELARINVLGTALGTAATIAFVAAFGDAGVAAGLVALSAGSLLVSWWYARRVKVAPVALLGGEVRQLLALGSAFMASGVLTLGAAFLVRLLVLRQEGLESSGLYQAAWTLGGLYVGFVLQAMGADFYPRLVGAITTPVAANRLVNEQSQASLLLAGPGVLATLTFAGPAIALFYSGDFAPAEGLLRWIVLGMALRVITWPIGYIIVASNRKALFFGAELAWTLVNLVLSWWCITFFGLDGAGIAFFGSYIFHGVMVYAIARRLTGFHWSKQNAQTGALFIASIAAVFVGFATLPPVPALGAGVAVTAVTTVWALRRLMKLVPVEHLPKPFKRLAVLFSSQRH